MRFSSTLLLSVFAATAPAQAQSSAIDVLNYTATVEPSLVDKTVRGHVSVELRALVAAVSVELDIGALTIDAVTENGSAREFTQGQRRLKTLLKTAAQPNETRTIEITYHGTPRFGLTFVPAKSQVYTIFSTDQWMPCINAPSDRATLSLTVVTPADLTVIANGRLVADRPQPDGRVSHDWRLDRAAPTFSFGFAAAKFNEVADKRGRTNLRYLSTTAAGADLQRLFADTGDMIGFFEDRSGVPYPAASYSQALVEDTVGQEMSGFSLMSDEYAAEVLKDPTRVGLIAHELAHQWWGIGVTCQDWTHFWLNEGFATFMAAAYREKKFGRETYLRDVEGWRARYERVKTAGKDRSLAFTDWNKPTSDDRALVYQKGALVLHELRQELGDKAFWKGLCDYTRAHFDKPVTTSDFFAAMEKSSGKKLIGFFDRWVFAKSPVAP
ncbi:MAG: M1 family metallopeptidase [Vicinamibacteria bacterium]